MVLWWVQFLSVRGLLYDHPLACMGRCLTLAASMRKYFPKGYRK